MNSLDRLFEQVNRHGPLVVERTICPHCDYMEFQIHGFAESLPCARCQKRQASAVPMYKADDGWEKPRRQEPGLVMTLKVYDEPDGVRLKPRFKAPVSLSLIGAVSVGMAKIGRQLAASKGISEEKANGTMFGE